MNKDTNQPSQQCSIYSSSDCARFVRMHPDENGRAAFLSHAELCQNCRATLLKETIVWRKQQDELENRLLRNQTLSIMDRLDQNIFSIVIKAAQGVVELIRSTGELLTTPPAFAGTRSLGGADAGANNIVCITQEIDQSRLSVEVAISPLDPDVLLVQVSLLDRQQEEFVAGALVVCTGETFSHSGVTDESGQVEFRIPATGFFELTLSQEERLLGTITLTGL